MTTLPTVWPAVRRRVPRSLPVAPVGWLLVAAVAAAGSLAVRANVVRDRPLCGYLDNDDAPAHVLATWVAYDQTPLGHHKLLPIVTLGDRTNKWEPAFRDAGGFDRRGNFYYSSFPPPAFAAPYLVGKLLGAEPTPAFLRGFAVGLHLLTTLTLVLLVWAVADGWPTTRRAAAAAVAAAVFLTAPEAVRSYTVSYWSHQLYQPILFLQLWCVARGRFGWGLAGLTFLGCLTEWTGFTTAAGLVAVCGANLLLTRDRHRLWDAVRLGGSAAVAGGTLVGWYGYAIGVRTYLSALGTRAKTRAALAEPAGPGEWVGKLLDGYADSLGPFLYLAAAGTVLAILCSRRPAGDRTPHFPHPSPLTPHPSWIAVGLAAMLENVVMSQHAVTYSYARLKLVGLVAVGLGLLAGRFPRLAPAVAAAVLACGAVSLAGFAREFDRADGYRDFAHARYRQLGELIRSTCPADAVALGEVPVRGAEIYYAGRNLIEIPVLGLHDSPDVAAKLAEHLEHYCHVHGTQSAVAYQVQPDAERFVVTHFELVSRRLAQTAYRFTPAGPIPE